MGFWQSMYGMLQVELTSADPASALFAIQKNGIDLHKIEKTQQLQIRFEISRRDYARLQKLVSSRSDSLRITKKYGGFWTVSALRKRPVLLIGILCLFLVSLWVPGRIFFVQVEGNSRIPARLIAESAAECGITFGANRREVRSERMKNALLEAIPQLSWAGINTNGCTAVITVRERSDVAQQKQEQTVSSIVASRDGVIREITVLRGNALCVTGQAVQEGQVLISGYTDCGICIQATCADGEVFADTKREQTAVMPTIFTNRMSVSGTEKKYSLIIGKKRINFANSSGISDTTCAKIYEEKYMTLPGGFVLPIAVAVETWIYYDTEENPHPLAAEILLAYSRQYLTDQMLAGSIVSTSERLRAGDGILYLDAGYDCYEMIGITRIEENVLEYGEND